MSTTTTTPSKRKSSTTTSSSSTPKTIHFTSRTPTWTYLKLQLINNPPTTSSTSTPLDPLTARTYLSAALSQFLGLTGTTIPIDILKISPPSSSTGNKTGGGGSGGLGSTVWTRVPRDDAAAVVAALSSWIGGSANTSGGGGGDVGGGGGSVAWRVCAKGNYLGALVNGGGGEVFIP
ncbi:uncharacterized protein BO88DRAFT_490610 [Aspergillus vadensis CBS 113365]|uniref:Ribonucleases P/MRP subunit Pop8-like domain-containing protein n=1 Tax=Aspergillus vadensis (strain CBS 113365 / IMI 142717 / IBT 24658) TaxID=1448311 RepID=A0A319AY90_ASPVC|nr:hypothetical protein BO88DRAFT_490610 [Aspergillus vadensis CBS 113365]PYH65356.1 hypothetical protein BO88DRAFT_490610 [Aspergillus vadensis CBS 113365]